MPARESAPRRLPATGEWARAHRPVRRDGRPVRAATGDVRQVGGDARAAVHGDGGGVLVATGWVAHDFDTELRLDALAGGGYWRPRESNTEQAPLQQERVRLFFFLREVRAVGAVDGGEQRVLAMVSAQRLRMRSTERLMALVGW